MLGVLIFFLGNLLMGIALMSLIKPLRRVFNFNKFICLATAYIFGSLTAAILQMIQLFIFKTIPTTESLYVLFIVGLLLSFWSWRKKILNFNKNNFNFQFKKIDKFLFGLILIQVCLVLVLAYLKPLQGWDSMDFWSYKAKILAENPQAVLDSNSNFFWKVMPKPNYPWGINLMINELSLINSFYDDSLNNYIFVGFYLSALAIIYGASSKHNNLSTALVATYFLASLPLFFYHSWNAYADLPLAVCVLLAGFFMYDFFTNKIQSSAQLSLLILSLSFLIKLEGIFYLLCGIFILFFYNLYNKFKLSKAIYCLWPLLFFGCWWLWVYFNNLGFKHGTEKIIFGWHPKSFWILFSNFSWQSSNWNILFYFLCAYWLYKFIKKQPLSKNLIWSWVWISLSFISFFGLYLFTSTYRWAEDLTALPRNMLTLVPTVLLFISLDNNKSAIIKENKN